MQSQNPFLDEMAKLTSSAMSLAQAAGEEAKAAMRAQADRFVADMDLVRRDEIDALKAEIAALREEVAALRAARTDAVATKTFKTKPADPATEI
ncbi:MAG: accessory factor UbiK family protein [Asticcacaulis sp.]|nr:accessory factor UbiK family protein [Asticcacaulis sp.]